jgi:small subunit ribosomal protein S8
MIFKSRGLINDSISDMLTRIRNATLAKKSNVNIPFTKLNQEIAQILKRRFYPKLSNFNGN